MTDKRFKLDDFDSEVEMWELMNTQAEIISDLEKENEKLKKFKSKFYNIIDERIRVLEHDYNQAVKNGMPSNSVYSEMELLEELKEEMDHI